MPIIISLAEDVNTELFDALHSLLPQLSSSAKKIEHSELLEIVNSPCSHLLIASSQETGEILGCLTLIIFRIPTGVRAWIEDVVVAETARGQGIGQSLIEAAKSKAKAQGAKTIDLTSRPSREAANRLYQRAGFSIRNTNVYRYELL